VNPSHAPYEVKFEVRPGYVYARVIAERVDRPTAMWFLGEAISECANHRKKRLLLERGNAGEVAEEELFVMMDELLKLSDETRIAFLNQHLLSAEKIREVIRYGAGRGGNYRCFMSFEKAEQWLLEDADE